VIVWHELHRARSWLTVGYDEGRKALPVNGNQSLGVTNSPPPGPGHHHVDRAAAAPGTDESLPPLEDARIGTVAACKLGGIRLDLMATISAPDDQPDTGPRHAAERHRRAGFGFHRAAARRGTGNFSTESSTPSRIAPPL
jgi:hypothetical protein